MKFELLDGYLLHGTPAKSEVVRRLLDEGPPVPAAAAFFEGMRLLKDRTPDLSLLALRLVLAGRPADDAAVLALRELSGRARAGGEDGRNAEAAFHATLGEG